MVCGRSSADNDMDLGLGESGLDLVGIGDVGSIGSCPEGAYLCKRYGICSNLETAPFRQALFLWKDLACNDDLGLLSEGSSNTPVVA